MRRWPGALALVVLVGCTANLPPERPVLSGDSVARPAETADFTVRAVDPEGGPVWFSFDWDTGVTELDWLGPWPGDSALTVLHDWPDAGLYEVSVKSRDERGGESDWSEPVDFAVTASGYLPAPDFQLPDLGGNNVRLVTLLENGPVCLVWWDLPCVNCHVELDSLQSHYDSLSRRGLEVLAISVDRPDDESRVRAFIEARGWTFPVLLDPHQLVKALFGVTVKPTTRLVSTGGDIVYTHVGFEPDEFDSLLANVVDWLP